MTASVSTGMTPAAEHAGMRLQLIDGLRVAERIAFNALIVLSPLRARFVIEDRSHGPIYGEYVDFLLYWSDIAFLALIALWALRLRAESRRPWLGPALARVPAAGLVVVAWLSVPFSYDTALSVYDALRLSFAVALGLYVANEVRSVRELVPAIALMLAVQAAVSVAQVVDQGSIGLHVLGENRLDAKANGTSIVWTESAGKLLRGYGLTDHPNILGGMLAFGLLVLVTGAAALKQRWLQALAIAVFGFGVAGLALSWSRSGELAFAAGFVLALALLAYRRHFAEGKVWLAAGVIGAVIGIACLVQYSEYLGARINPATQQQGSPEQRSLDERSTLARAANDIFVARPLLGVGIGALPVAIEQEYPRFRYNYQPAHGVLLDGAAETGILGAFFFGVLLVAPWLLLWYRRRQLTPELIGVSGAVLAVSIVGFLDYYPWGLAPGRIWTWLLLGLWVAAYGRMTRHEADA
jgi:hypothetical protein